jgi:hypothetical protein
MKNTARQLWSYTFFAVVFALVGWVSVCTTHAVAQTGRNAVYDSGGNCSPCKASPAFIDATVFINKPPSNDLCSVLNYVFVNIIQVTYPQGAVIDARGLPFTTPPPA